MGREPGQRDVDIRVRQARPPEVEELRRLEVDAAARFVAVGLAYVAGDEAPPPAWYLERLDRGRLWVAEAEAADAGSATRRIVGYAAASVVDDEGHLDQVSVLDGWSGHGIGAALVEAVATWARDRSDPALTLTTFRDVRFNGPWYRRLGFVEVPGDELGPELAAIRRTERERGLDRHHRIAMRLPLGEPR